MTWKRLAHQEITSTGDNFSEFEFAEADILKVVMYVVKQGTGDLTLYPNAVTSGSNFSANYTKNGGGYSGNNNHCGIHGNYGQLAGNTLATYHINNLKTSEKLVQWNYCIDTGSASTNLPDRFEAVGKYTDASNPAIFILLSILASRVLVHGLYAEFTAAVGAYHPLPYISDSVIEGV